MARISSSEQKYNRIISAHVQHKELMVRLYKWWNMWVTSTFCISGYPTVPPSHSHTLEEEKKKSNNTGTKQIQAMYLESVIRVLHVHKLGEIWWHHQGYFLMACSEREVMFSLYPSLESESWAVCAVYVFICPFTANISWKHGSCLWERESTDPRTQQEPPALSLHSSLFQLEW